MSAIAEAAQMIGAIGGLTGLGSGVVVYSLFARTKDLESKIEDCHKDRALQAERLGKLEGYREANEAQARRLEQVAHAVERAAESLAPPTHERMELDARTQELVDKHRKTPSVRPKRLAPLPPKVPTFPKGSK